MSHNRNLNRFFKLLGQSILFWTFAVFSYAIFRFYGVEQELVLSSTENVRPNSFRAPLIMATSIGFGLGIIYGLVDFIYDKYLFKKVSIGAGLVLNALFHFISTVFVVTLGIGLFSKVFPIPFEIKPGWWIHEKGFWAFIWYIILSSLVFSFLKIAKERFGPGLFLKMLLGRYKIPKEEERVFMFLDLKDSTTIAEKLGHLRYSRFIQDCFFDLNEVVSEYQAGIYQYVGDEAVLSWPYHKALLNNNCLGVFFAFQSQREARRTYYQETYGVFPEFKAGLHGGSLMAAEVGFVKKELAYHGDVINTSARIQAECNKHNTTLLISEKLLNDLQDDVKPSSKLLGSILLKGKEKKVKIHSVVYNG